MIIVKLENDNYDGTNDNKVNKLVFFDQKTGIIKVKGLAREMDTMKDYGEINAVIRQCLRDDSVKHKIVNTVPVKGGYSAPFKLYVDITDKCQLNCKHCLTKYLNNDNEISIEDIKDIAEECKKLGIMQVKLGGGEPTLHPNFYEILDAFTEAGCYISMSTNGYNVNQKMAKKLKEHNVKTTVSIEGNEGINDSIRGKGHFKRAIRALEMLQDEGVDVKLRVTLTRAILNEDVIKEILTFSDTYNTKVKFSYCRPSGSSIDNKLLINYQDYEQYFKIIQLLNSKEYRNKVLLDEGMMLEQPDSLKSFIYKNKICGAANRSMHINSKLEISPCVFLGNDYKEKEKYRFGDIEKYWREEKGENFRKVRKIPIAGVCKSCKRICKNECTATRLFFKGSTNYVDPNCIVRREDDDNER